MVRYKNVQNREPQMSRSGHHSPAKEREPSSNDLKQSKPYANQRTKRSLNDSQSKPKKKYCLNGELALREIRKYQGTCGLLVPRLPFARVVRMYIGRLFGVRISEFRIERLALEALQEATEAFLVQFFEDCLLCSMHAKRRTILPRDVHLVLRMRGHMKK